MTIVPNVGASAQFSSVFPLEIPVSISGAASADYLPHFLGYAVFTSSQVFRLDDEFLQSERSRPARRMTSFNKSLKLVLDW